MENNGDYLENGYLDKLMEDVIKNTITFQEVGSILISRRLSDVLGVTLTTSQIEEIKNDLAQKPLDKFTVELNSEQEEILKKIHDDHNITLDISENIDEFFSDLTTKLVETVIKEVVPWISKTYLESLKSQAHEVLKEEKRFQAGMVEGIYKVWGKPIDLLEMLIGICEQEGSRFNSNFREDPLVNTSVFDVLVRLHARSCQVANEIQLLMKNGFSDGAHARWRTLHELSVTASFINEHGSLAAERYSEHLIITDYKEAREYQKHCEALGYPPLRNEELPLLKKRCDDLLSKYGKEYRKVYGWAALWFPNERSPTFADLERESNLGHLRPFYNLANINVHAGSKGAIYRLGLPPNEDNIMLSGSSIFGLAEPGQNTAHSLVMVTIELLTLQPNLDRLSFMKTLETLLGEIYNSFATIERKLEDNRFVNSSNDTE